MKLGVIHYNFPGMALEEFLDYAKNTGFDCVELQIRDIWTEDIRDPEHEADRVAEEVRRRGLQVSALAAGNDFVLLDGEKIHRQVERMRRVCQLARRLGTQILRTEGGSPKDEVPETRWVEAMATCLKQCIPFAEEMDVYLAVDNHGLVTNDGDRELLLFKEVDSNRVGANLDTMNYRWFGHDVDTVHRFIKEVAPYAFHIHMKDGIGSRSEYIGAVLGEGELDIPRALKDIRDAGYDGTFTVEYEGREPSTVGYTRCFQYLKKHL